MSWERWQRNVTRMEHVITLSDSREPDRVEPADDDGASPARRLADLLRVEHIDR